MLSLQLKELEADGIVHRAMYPQVPPKVEYPLTELDEALAPALLALYRWGDTLYDREGLPRPFTEEDIAEPKEVAARHATMGTEGVVTFGT